LDSRRSLTETSVAILLGVLILAALSYFNYRYTAQNPGGNDFLSRWVGVRLLLTRGYSPYGERVTQQIHAMAYGRAAQPDEDQMLFAYPLYVSLIVAPFALVGDYALARALWMSGLEMALVLLVIVSITLSRWKMSRWLLAALLVFSLTWYHGFRPIINGNPSIWVALLITLAFLAIRSDQDALAGFCLALSTIKPQMVVLIIPFTLFWAAHHRRWGLIWGFLGSLALLIAAFSLIIPDWLIQNLKQILAYPRYTLPGTPGAILSSWLPGVGRQLGWGITITLSAMLLYEWWVSRRAGFRWFYWTACLTLVVTNLIGVPTATENYVAMLPALILLFSVWDERWRARGRGLVIVSMLFLFFGLWALFLNTLQQGDQPIQHPIMFFPFPLLLLVGLYWIRWWAIRPPKVLLEELRGSPAGEII